MLKFFYSIEKSDGMISGWIEDLQQQEDKIINTIQEFIGLK
jgi:hypothetical protein